MSCSMCWKHVVLTTGAPLPRKVPCLSFKLFMCCVDGFLQSKKEELCKLSDIVRAKVESKMGHEDIMYTTVLELKDGKTVPIFQSSSNIEAYHIREAKKINEFLHCPRGDLVIKEGGFIMGIVLLVFAVVFGGLAFSFSALFSPYIQ